MPTYLHECQACNKEFEDFYSITADPPTICPLCNAEGKIKRLIYGGSGRGIVELSGHELKDKIKEDAGKMLHEANKNENYLANLVGEDRYQKNVSHREYVARELRPSFRKNKR